MQKKPKSIEAERLISAINLLIEKGLARSFKEVAEKSGYKSQDFTDIKAGKKDLRRVFLDSIVEKYPVNKIYILTGEGQVLNIAGVESEVKIYDHPDTLIAPLIGQYAHAGYLRGFADPEYLEEQPIYYARKKHNGGNYVAFEVNGDSMNDGSLRSICEGDIILGRELQRELWVNRLHVPKVFIVVHKEDGITVKEILDHNTETGDIHCHSWNPSLEYQDFTLNLNDIAQLFYIKEVSRSVKF